jgi:hypothetical protein
MVFSTQSQSSGNPGQASFPFLVQEGQIKADTVVRHALPGIGVGLKFSAVSEQNRPQLAALMTKPAWFIAFPCIS